MDERKIADYFVVAGLPQKKEAVDEFTKDSLQLKSSHNRAPITDIAVIFPTLGEAIPDGFNLISTTPTGLPADLNHGSLRSPEVYLCYRRGRDKPPLVDIGVMYEGKEKILEDSEMIEFTPNGKSANVNNSNAKTLVTYRRAPPMMACNSLVVTDIVVIITNKGETPPHAFNMIKKNLNKGLVGSDVFLCYKKSMNRANLISYKPGILNRYPNEDQPRLPLPATVPMFCLPMGCTLERWPATAQQSPPIFSTFVLTVSDAAEKLYGSAVTFYEPYPAENLSEEQRKALEPNKDEPSSEWTYHVNKCICLLSRWPFFDTFEKFLNFIYEMSSDLSEHTVPIERFVSYLVEDVPFPSPQRPRILIQLSPNDRLILTQPEQLPLPRSGASFRQLLMNLGPENCLLLLLCALTEQKILVHSLRPDVLTAVAEAISMMVFPFKWQCPYIPLCPLSLAEVLNAPLPFLIGVDSRFFDLYDPPLDVNCVDLDTHSITVCDEKRHLAIKVLPKKAGRLLKLTLEHLLKKCHQLALQLMEHSQSTSQSTTEYSIEKDFQLKHKEQGLELEIEEAFLRFMASVLKGYRGYLLPITKAPTVGTTDTNSLFDLSGFLRSRDKTHYKFYHMLTKTQMFIRFIEERSFVSDMDTSLAFFDECTEKVEYEEELVRLLEVDESHRNERTMFIMPPEPHPLHTKKTYKGFNLEEELFYARDRRHNDGDSPGRKGLSSHIAAQRLSSSGLLPGSPMARRTKHEIKVAARLARKYYLNPKLWARCLVATCYSIWFIHLPSYVMVSEAKAAATLRYSYDVLCRVHKTNLTHIDEVCYRVMMQLCGAYSQPVVAVKLLFLMKRSGLQPNAITYGFYNRAVLEATWPSGMNNSSQLLWNKLRNVILGAALFRKAGMTAGRRKQSVNEDSLLDGLPETLSHASMESSETKSQGDSLTWSSQLNILFPKSQRDTSAPIALQVILTTCSRCHNCASILYDEEIMAGWVPEDSNLNTKCQFCDKGTVPLLCVTVIDYRCTPMPATSQESIRERKLSSISIGASRSSIGEADSSSKLVNGSLDANGSSGSAESKTHDPITVPYLNPLVLRKEFESILSAEGDVCLTQSKFVDEHPIIYWNMMWVFSRIGMESHLGGLALGASCSSPDPHPSWANADSSNVLVSTMWHNNQLNEEAGQPMFMLWNQEDQVQSSLVNALVTDHNVISRSLMEKVISCLQLSDLAKPVKFLAKERQKGKGRGHSLYRDILFLAISALGRENIDLGAFDREYMTAYKKAMERESKLYLRCDQPLSANSYYCRNYFKPLSL